MSVAGAGDTHAPVFHRAVASQCRGLLRSPRTDVLALAGNAAIVLFGWWVLPQVVRDWLFGVDGPVSFVIVLETWMMGDVTSTNVVAGNVALREAAARPADFERILRAFTAAKGLFVAVPSALVALAIGIHEHRPMMGALIAVAACAAPIAVFPLTALIGIVLPINVRSLRWRIAHRRPWRGTARWLLLRFTPYTVVATIMAVLIAPAVIVGRSVGVDPTTGRLVQNGAAAAVLVFVVLCAVIAARVPVLAARLAARRAERLRAYLDDPDLP